MSNVLAKVTLQTYRILGSIIYPFMGPILVLRAQKGKEDRERRYERYGYPSARKPKGPIVWFHAASVGEALAVIPLIQRVNKLGINSVITTGTVTSAEIVKNRLPKGAFHQYVPLDLKPAVKRFLDHWKPDLSVFTESEIWPMTVLELGARRIPQVLVNARMSDRSFARWKKALPLAGALFDYYSHVIAQSEIDAERFRILGARPVVVSGNLKVDTEPLPVVGDELERVSKLINGRPCWVAASTHKGEEKIACEVHTTIADRIPDLLTIIVPRHPDRADDIAAEMKEAGLKVARRSHSEEIKPDTQIYLGDTIGEMGLYFRLASVAFIGRSLVGTGGQNPLEPAMIGTAIISGKHVHNFRDAYRNLVKSGGVRMVGDEKMLADNVEYLLKHEDGRERMVEAAKQTVDGMRGALNATIHVLDSYTFPLTVKRDLEGME
ncbi:MAG: lipid IV(A) 3-deoxy-D-manno-octulosonic acid transferase [Rhizobiaceae bacterium]